MEIKFDYYIRRKSDNKLIQILHETLSEEEIIEVIKTKFTAPINYDMENEYEFSDIDIVEVSGLR